MTRKITKSQAKEIIRREEHSLFVLQLIGALIMGLVSVTLSIAWFACAFACVMRGFLLADDRSGANIRVPATAVAIAVPWLFIVATGEYMLQFNLQLYLLITMSSAIYFGAIRRDNPLHVAMLANGVEDQFRV